MFLNSINNLRALSIIFIVFGHTYWISGWQPQSWLAELYFFIFLSGTFYFVFISGFLFNHLSVNKFSYKKFMRQKLRNVISPYVCLSILPIIAAIHLKTVYPEYFFTPGGEGIWLEYIKPALLYLLSGRMLTAYWYIPFIFLMFLISPVFVQYSKLSIRKQIALLFIGLLISGFTYRAPDNINPLQAVVYFTPMFMFGMLCSIHNHKIKEFLTPYAAIIVMISIALSFYQLSVLDIHGNLAKDMFEYGDFNFKQLEKGIQILGVYLLFDKYLTKDYRLLSLLASSSFAIFFLHPIIIFIVKRIVPTDWTGPLYWHSLSVFVIASCILIATFLKKILGKKSRLVIGW